jgi:hypothetical protein
MMSITFLDGFFSVAINNRKRISAFINKDFFRSAFFHDSFCAPFRADEALGMARVGAARVEEIHENCRIECSRERGLSKGEA